MKDRLAAAAALLTIGGLVAGALVGVGSSSATALGAVSARPVLSPFYGVPTQGHPQAGTMGATDDVSSADLAGSRGLLPPEPLAPLASGEVVNFESPPVKALALSDDGSRLYAANTPNGSLVVFDTATTPMAKIAEIPVGIDPVSVAAQPGGGELVWVTNFISDNVSVVDVSLGRVVDVIDVGDEPVNVLFDDSGEHAFVVVQGTPSVLDPNAPVAGVVQEGALVAIDTTTRQVIRSLHLDMHTPRGAAWVEGRIAVSALHSGNNTTVVGQPVTLESEDGQTGDPLAPLRSTGLAVVQFFSATAPLFADPLLSPWPDVGVEPNAPVVQRIVPDAAEPGAWADIVATLSTQTGQADPAMVSLLEAELATLFNDGRVFTNVAEVLQSIIDDAPDTADHDIALVDPLLLTDPLSTTASINRIGEVGATLPGLGVNPATGELLVSNMEPRNLVRPEPALRGHFIDHQISIVDASSGSVTRADLHGAEPSFNDASAPNPAAQAASLANPVDVVVRSDGSRAYVAALGVGRVGVLDAASAAVIGVVDVGRGTRSLALDEQSDRLYALNRTDMTIATLDVASDAPGVIGHTPMFNPEAADVREGRDFLYSARFSNNFSSSCAMCHIDGRLDHTSWDLGDPDAGIQFTPHVIAGADDPCTDIGGQNHPLKGPMVTLSLQGLFNHDPLHWRGDRPDFPAFNAAFDKLLGGSELTDAQMAQYTAFVHSMVYPPAPFRNPDNSFADPGANVGRDVFMNACNACHQVSNDGAMTFTCSDGDAGFNLNGLFFGQIQLTTQLRGIHKKLESDRFTGFGLIHDGREERKDNEGPLDTFLEDFFPGIPAAGLDDELKAFVAAFPTNVMPVVGEQVLIDSAPTPQQTAAIDVMIQQHAMTPSRADVIAKGTLDGAPRGFVLIDPAGPTFQSDDGSSISFDDLLAGVGGGDALLFTGVPPGSGERLGVNQDMDCDPDALDPFPQKNADFDDDGGIGASDLAVLLAVWGDDGALTPSDFDDSGAVDAFDLSVLLGSWGACQ